MPEENAAGSQDTRELPDDTDVVVRIGKEAEGCEKVEDRVESPTPSRWKLSHVTASVMEQLPGAPLARNPEQMLRVIEPFDSVSRLGEEMRVTALSAGHVEHS